MHQRPVEELMASSDCWGRPFGYELAPLGAREGRLVVDVRAGALPATSLSGDEPEAVQAEWSRITRNHESSATPQGHESVRLDAPRAARLCVPWLE